jgi:signal transduction histidine kinase
MLVAMLHRSTARTALGLHAGISVAVAVAVFIVWAATGGSFWPAWVYLGLAVPLALHAGVWWALDRPTRAERGLAVHGVVGVVLCLTDVAVWGLVGGGDFFPVWLISVFSITIPVHALIVYRRRLFAREQQLTERVDELTRTRRGALDVQAAELRRIERDLHDGAQARLVALSMHLGRAEERLQDQPEVAELVRKARGEATAAIGELRDLARGIAPPVLADRGLMAAVEALGQRAAIPVTVRGAIDPDRRPVPAIETAAYFVVAEALTNVAKHAPDAHATVTVSHGTDVLSVEIADDGPGGADPAGSGLTGLRHRVEAVDGTLHVTSIAGTGTLVRVELPCGS